MGRCNSNGLGGCNFGLYGSRKRLQGLRVRGHKWGHNKDRQPWHLVLAYKANNIEICGGGTIDGNGQAFWQDWHLDSLPKWIMAKDEKVSPMLEIEECTNAYRDGMHIFVTTKIL